MTDVESTKWESFKRILPYILAGTATILVVFFGSLSKQESVTTLSFDSFAKANSDISVDQLSELYVVANLSNALSLVSASDVASNYVVATSMYDAGQTATGKLEKPSITDIAISRGVVEYVVVEGDTMDSIAAKYGITADQIRWSNNLKTKDISPGNVLLIPSVPGIVYTVKSGDTIESIAAKYGSSATEIIALNDLEVSGISEGARIVIKNGSLPETERPEYVAPVRNRTYNYTYTYTYRGDTSNRTAAYCNRGLGAGQCTTWGWIKRPDLRSVTQTHAKYWDDRARAAGILVNRTPSAGAIFQTDSGGYGHVGYVESVNADGSINVSERNYAGCWGVMFSTIPASEVGKFNYIH